MNLKERVESEMKDAMRARNQLVLQALRSIKSMILLAETAEGRTAGGLTEEEELKLLTKAAKQRKESADTYADKGRQDLAEVELAELAVIERFLPKQMDESEIEAAVKGIIAETGASSIKDMGKVMGQATKALAGKADNQKVSAIVKKLLA